MTSRVFIFQKVPVLDIVHGVSFAGRTSGVGTPTFSGQKDGSSPTLKVCA